MEELLNFESFINSYEMVLPSVKAFYNEIRNAEGSLNFIKSMIDKIKEKSFKLENEEYEKLKNAILYLYQFYILRVQDTKVGFDSFKSRIISFIEYISSLIPEKSNTSTEKELMINSVNNIDTSSSSLL